MSKTGKNAGQMKGNAQKEHFSDPMNVVSESIHGVSTHQTNLGEKTGFVVDGYIDKKGMVYGEAAKLNFMPPGMDISNQENVEINDMPMRKLTAESYPGDGW